MQAHSNREIGSLLKRIATGVLAAASLALAAYLILVQLPAIREAREKNNQALRQQVHDGCVQLNISAHELQEAQKEHVAVMKNLANSYATDPYLIAYRDLAKLYRDRATEAIKDAQDGRHEFMSEWALDCKGITPPPYK